MEEQLLIFVPSNKTYTLDEINVAIEDLRAGEISGRLSIKL